MQHQTLQHRFVRNVPRELEPGVLYLSMEYATAVHSCCCGCGERVVTPFTPTDWRMTFDGESVSLSPSVGNWNQDCQSHYVIERGHVIEAGPWSRAQVEAEQRRDKRAKARFYAPGSGNGGAANTTNPPCAAPQGSAINHEASRGARSRLWRWLTRAFGLGR